MGLFDRSSSSVTNQQNINEYSYGLSGIDAPVALGGNVSVLDGGAIDRSFDYADSIATQSLSSTEKLALQSIKNSQTGLDSSLDFATKALLSVGAAGENAAKAASKTQDILSDAINKAADATRSDASQVLTVITKYGAYAVIAIAAAYLLTKYK